MMRGKRGQTLLWSIVVAVLIFMAGMVFMNFVKPEITNAEAPDGLDCSGTSISDGTKLTCIGTAAVVPYLFIVILSAAGGAVAAKFV